MLRLEHQLSKIRFGADTDANAPFLERGTMDAGGPTAATPFTANATGTSIRVTSGTPANTKLYSTGGVWNALWNDIADFQLLSDELVFGKCYFDTKDGARICTERCQMSVIGIASDTFGMCVGHGANPTEVPIAVAGWVLAYVDQEYACGTPLTNNEQGILTAMSREEKLEYPERIVALYKRKELDAEWGGPGRMVKVDGRHWVKIK